MTPARLLSRSSPFACLTTLSTRPLSTSTLRYADFTALNARKHDTADAYRKYQQGNALNPHMTNTTSTIANEMPSVGQDAPPPELVSATEKGFEPKDAVPENTERMTGGTQKGKGKGRGAAKDLKGKEAPAVTAKEKAAPAASVKEPAKAKEETKAAGTGGEELGVGEMEGAKFKVEPLRRTGEDVATTRARLLYQSRKRGTLESDLLLSTFADAHLSSLPPHLLQQYDLFLDENDWDIYYWATQEPTPTSAEYAEGGGPDVATPTAQGEEVQGKDEWKRAPATGEWAQTVGTFKPAYRPVPKRWKGSEILALLRRHVKEKSAGGVTDGIATDGKTGGGGLGMMPDIKNFAT
ncbi:DUF339-domain-containing protein [Amniculicola lignicola CBS 123094]|uniref:Succinate dehydrogenase assembly factor 2, mitochondrial n=1 Tax=Amniculicola lignicola CBS 123094 TaxID=1392246 RepID=A0A6A5VV38_9PLEO|nr:DUF339-domain-containing protein [Amniculicola lignicola CBS 123094]